MHDVKSTHKVSENRFRVQWSTAPFSPVCLATVGQAWAFHCDSREPSVSLACWTHHTGRLTNWRSVTVVSVVYQEVVTQCVTPQLPPCPPLYSPVCPQSHFPPTLASHMLDLQPCSLMPTVCTEWVWLGWRVVIEKEPQLVATCSDSFSISSQPLIYSLQISPRDIGYCPAHVSHRWHTLCSMKLRISHIISEKTLRFSSSLIWGLCCLFTSDKDIASFLDGGLC